MGNTGIDKCYLAYPFIRCQILCLLLVIPWMVQAQAGQIRGRVLDATSDEPLPYANVFINNTTLGASADLNGNYLIHEVPEGTHEVVFSYVGYQSYQARVVVTKEKEASLIIRLKPADQQLQNIEVSGSRDKEWERQLGQFEKIFIGSTPNSLQCKIANPWVLNFNTSNNHGDPLLTATASQPVEINNLALGYHIYFYMRDFKADAKGFSILGNFQFEEMNTTDPKMAERWTKNRGEAYYGSDRHLFKAILDNRLREEGFQLYTDKSGYQGSTVRSALFSHEINKSITAYHTENIVTPSARPGVYRIALKGRIEIHYLNQTAPKKVYRDLPHVVGWLETSSGYVDVNANGVPLNTIDIVTSGYINDDRVADLLPYDYVPDKSVKVMSGEERVSVSNAKLTRLQERVYLHTDKSYYYPGEAIWLKGYLNYRVPDLMDSLSRVVYVELISPDKKVFRQLKLKVDSGRVAGQFFLPDSVKSGSWCLRAYTHWMLNFPREEIFVKPIPILQLTEKVVAKPLKDEPDNTNSNIRVLADKGLYQTREKISLEISVSDRFNEPLSADFSISVTDADQAVPVNHEMKITDGFDFRRQLLTDSIIISYPMEYGIGISGSLVNDKGKPEKATITAIQGKMEDINRIETDQSGKFFMQGFQFTDTVLFAFQAKNAKGKPFGRIQLEAKSIPGIDQMPQPMSLEIHNTTDPQRYPVFHLPGDARLLEEIVVTSEPIDEQRTRQGIAYGNPDYSLSGDKLTGSNANQNLLVALQGKVPGLQITTYWEEGFQRYIVKIRGGSSVLNLAQSKEVFEPLVIVNGVPFGGGGITAAEQLQQISVYDVERVEVITRANPLLGVRGTNGAIAIYTKSGSVLNANTTPAMDQSKFQLITVKGYDTSLKFAMPDYQNKNEDHSQPDYRSTIFWEPWKRTDERGKARVEFFSADLPTRYRVVIEGVTTDGNPFHHESFIEIMSR